MTHGFTSDEAIELWGVARHPVTDARTYWLVAGDTGARVAPPTPAAGAVAPASFTRHRAPPPERKVYLSSILNGEASNFYGAPVGPTAPIVQTRRGTATSTAAQPPPRCA